MSGLLKCLVLTSAVLNVFAITSVRDDATWFKKGDRLKEGVVNGVVNGIFDPNCEETVNGATVQGECTNKLDCAKSKGKSGSHCSLLGVCCIVEKTCEETTTSKLSYFVTPTKFTSDCPLTVKVLNRNVCQLRLDFEDFELAQPTSTEIQGEGQMVTHTSYQCQTDTFKVEDTKKNLGFSSLCGKNKGQHIYVPVAENQETVVIRFNLKARQAGDNLPDPKWRIKIRQLECQRSAQHHHLNAPSKLMALYQNLKNKKHPKSDYELLAPPNCLQYYPEKTGQFESFNYDNGNGVYMGPLNYAVCFRKTPEVCAVRYTSAGAFQMNYNPYRGGNVPVEDRCHPRLAASRDVSQDYIRIPGGINTAQEFKDYFCDTDFNPMSNTVLGKSFEPLYVGVHTDGFRANQDNANPEDFQEVGFRLKYELESGNCDNL